jgi:nucleoside-diphosphate-sugar epimerase
MNLLLIGGSGFLSGTIARQAVAHGHRVWAVTRGQRPLPDGVQALVADRHDTAALRRAVQSCGQTFDLCVDCIAYRTEDLRQDLELLRALAGHLVFISTDFVFDPARRRFPQPVEHHEFLRDDSYGAHKRRCEELLLSADTGAMRWTILRPCHIYGPGSLLGCLPRHGRDPELLARLRRGEALHLVGAGHYLQQPIFAEDLAQVALACPRVAGVHGRIFHTAGPDLVESLRYYAIVAEVLGVELRVEEVPVEAYRSAHPEHVSFLCHRIYDLGPLAAAGLPVPATPLAEGLRRHVASMATPG